MLTEIWHLEVTCPLGGATGGPRAGRTSCAVRRTPGLQSAERHVSAHCPPPWCNMVTSSLNALLCGTVDLAHKPSSCGKVGGGVGGSGFPTPV